MIIAIVMVILVVIVLILLSFMLNQYLNDIDQSHMADNYSKKAKQHNDNMVKKENRNGS